MTPEKLDAWLTRVTNDGYLQLIEGDESCRRRIVKRHGSWRRR